MGRLISVLVGVLLVAAACSSDGDESSAAAGSTDSVAEDVGAAQGYLDEVRQLTSETLQQLDETFTGAGADLRNQSAGVGLVVLAETLETAIELVEDQAAGLAVLVPPAEYTADHDLFLTYLSDQLDLWERQLEAALAGDPVAVGDLDVEQGRLQRRISSDLSPEFSEYVLDVPEVELAEDIFRDLSAEEVAYLDVLEAGMREFGRRAQEFELALQRNYQSTELLLAALAEAGAGEAFAATRDVIVEAEPPADWADAHRRVMAYLDDAVRHDRNIGEAARSGDVVRFTTENLQLELIASEATLELPVEIVAVMFGEIPIEVVASTAEGLPGGAYGAELHDLLHEWAIFVRRPVRPFGALALDELAASLAAAVPLQLTAAEDLLDGLTALEPPPEFAAGHELVVDHLSGYVAREQEVAAAAAANNHSRLQELGVSDVRPDQSAFDYCDTAEQLRSEPIAPITQVLYGTTISGIEEDGSIVPGSACDLP